MARAIARPHVKMQGSKIFCEPGPDEIRNAFFPGLLLTDQINRRNNRHFQPAGWNFRKSGASNPRFRSQPPGPPEENLPQGWRPLALLSRAGAVCRINCVGPIGTQSKAIGSRPRRHAMQRRREMSFSHCGKGHRHSPRKGTGSVARHCPLATCPGATSCSRRSIPWVWQTTKLSARPVNGRYAMTDVRRTSTKPRSQRLKPLSLRHRWRFGKVMRFASPLPAAKARQARQTPVRPDCCDTRQMFGSRTPRYFGSGSTRPFPGFVSLPERLSLIALPSARATLRTSSWNAVSSSSA